ncbi:hypothetical protein GOODEAATRI_028805 [Goodea atripinnis]|uniref:Uncharacterized protein n=1 Tax=Goodea atripinnis TaxID=208336 RepID=A0ABV0PSH9_9TELE
MAGGCTPRCLDATTVSSCGRTKTAAVSFSFHFSILSCLCMSLHLLCPSHLSENLYSTFLCSFLVGFLVFIISNFKSPCNFKISLIFSLPKKPCFFIPSMTDHTCSFYIVLHKRYTPF